MAQITLSLVDVVRGQPIDNVEIEVQKMIDGTWRPIGQHVSDEKGYATIVRDDDIEDSEGFYEATASIGAYFLKKGYVLPTLKCIDILPLKFRISNICTISKVIVAITPFGYSLTVA